MESVPLPSDTPTCQVLERRRKLEAHLAAQDQTQTVTPVEQSGKPTVFPSWLWCAPARAQQIQRAGA